MSSAFRRHDVTKVIYAQKRKKSCVYFMSLDLNKLAPTDGEKIWCRLHSLETGVHSDLRVISGSINHRKRNISTAVLVLFFT